MTWAFWYKIAKIAQSTQKKIPKNVQENNRKTEMQVLNQYSHNNGQWFSKK